MPQAIIPIIGYAASAITATALAVNLAIIAGTMAISSYQKRKAERVARAEFDASQVDRVSNVMTQIASEELVLGRVRKGGPIFFRSTTGVYSDRLYLCLALAAHEIDGVEQIYLNDTPVALDGSGYVTTGPWGQYRNISTIQMVTSKTFVLSHTPVEQGTNFWVQEEWQPAGPDGDVFRLPVRANIVGNTITMESFDPTHTYRVAYQYVGFEPKARIWWHLGGPGQSADGVLQAAFPGVWTAQHIGVGIAYLVCELLYDETAFPSGPPTISALVRGAKVYDPRTGTTYFSENPALHQRFVLTHPQFGKRASLSAAEDGRIAAAANACDIGINYAGALVPMYRSAIVVPYGAPARDVLDDLAQAMGGQCAYAGGEFHTRAGVYQAPVMSVTEADLAVVQRDSGGGVTQGQISISAHMARNDKINTVLPRIWDESAGYLQVAINPFRASVLIASDGAELVQEVNMAAVFYAPQAYHIAGIMLRDAREPMTVTAPFKLRVYQVELFDTITLTIERYGWNSKEFRVIGRSFLPNGYLQLTLKANAATIFQYGADFIPRGYAGNTQLPEPWNIQPPQIISIESGEGELIIQSDGTILNGVRVTWSALQNLAVTQGGYVEVQWTRSSTGEGGSVTVPGGETSAVVIGLSDGEQVMIRVRSRSSIAVSNWSPMAPHVVIGKTEPPPNIEDLSISGSILSWKLPRRVPDLGGFVFRFHYGNNLDWNSATALHTGVLTESPYDLITRPGGLVTIMGKAVDTTGNLSLASANIIMNLGDPPIANIVEQWDFKGQGWPFAAGEQSGWTLVDGNPAADALDSLYGTDEQSFYGADLEPLYDVEAYGQMVYVTPDVSVSSALAGSIMTLDVESQGTDLRIEYRLAGPGTFYGGDNDSFFRADADPFYGPPGGWLPWPGQVVAANDAYQFRVTIGAGTTRGVLEGLVLTIDAPDMEEQIADVPIDAAGTVIPYTKPFTAIRTVQATLQANASGAVSVRTIKSNPLAPVIQALNVDEIPISGATADITLKGY